MKNPITLTERASEVISNSLNARGKGLGIRFGTRTAGCSGQAYVMEFVDKLDTHDTLYEIDGNSVIIDEKSLVYLAGLEVDFKKEGLNEGFHFSNPNATGECGCGESFTV